MDIDRAGVRLAPAAVLSRIAAVQIGWEHQPGLRALALTYGAMVAGERTSLALEMTETDAEEVFALCESPIEEIMLAQIANRFSVRGFELDWQAPKLVCGESGPVVTAQAPVGEYVVDFLVEYKGRSLAVECDGHDFHDRTRLQVARDKQRDRRLVQFGIETLRFSGSEIWSNGIGCSYQIVMCLGVENLNIGMAG